MAPDSRNPMPTRTLALTGIHGFPGQKLLLWADQILAQRESKLVEHFDGIVAIDLHPPQTKLTKTRFFKLDLTETNVDQKLAEIFEREKVSALLHLAFQHNPTKHSGFAHELHSIGTMYLLNACGKQKIKKIVVDSTTHCYGAFPNNPNFLSEEHPLRGGVQSSYIRDRIDVENQMKKYQQHHPECILTVLRPCSILGPNIHNFATRYLSRKICLTPLGYDPLIQLVHEEDILRAFQMVLEKDAPGIFNIVGQGVLPLLTLLHLTGRIVIPLPNTVLYPMVHAMWQGNVAVVPPRYLEFLRYLWVADGIKAKEDLGFVPKYSTRETALAFVGSQRLKEVHLAAA